MFGQSGTPGQINLRSPASPTATARATPNTSSDTVRPMLSHVSRVFLLFLLEAFGHPGPGDPEVPHSVPSSVALLTVAACLVSGCPRLVHRAGLVFVPVSRGDPFGTEINNSIPVGALPLRAVATASARTMSVGWQTNVVHGLLFR